MNNEIVVDVIMEKLKFNKSKVKYDVEECKYFKYYFSDMIKAEGYYELEYGKVLGIDFEEYSSNNYKFKVLCENKKGIKVEFLISLDEINYYGKFIDAVDNRLMRSLLGDYNLAYMKEDIEKELLTQIILMKKFL